MKTIDPNNETMQEQAALSERLNSVRLRIDRAAARAGRSGETIRLVVVSKTVPVARVRLAIEVGAAIFGENYMQEAITKYEQLSHFPVSWHFIGHLQSNKAKYAVRLFELIHSVDSLKLAQELNKRAAKINKIQKILVQVNISQEKSKSGVETLDTRQLVTEIGQLENLRVKGLMTMPPFFDEPERARPYFRALAQLRNEIMSESIPNVELDELSMGMTGDFEAAIEEGATLVRIGTAIFGHRD